MQSSEHTCSVIRFPKSASESVAVIDVEGLVPSVIVDVLHFKGIFAV